jgi:ribonuclease HI
VRAFTSVSFVKVRGHSGDPNNEAADRLAQQAAAGVTVTRWGCPSGQVSARGGVVSILHPLLCRQSDRLAQRA